MNFFSYVDLTLLKPEASKSQIDNLISIAKKYQVAGVCVHPTWIEYVATELKGTNIKSVVVVGFPLGMNTLSTKVSETKEMLKLGAQEIDLVLNHKHIINNDYESLIKELKKIRLITHDLGGVLKVIIETSRLNLLQKNKVIEACIEAKVDFIKTSTGFTEKGATVEDVELIKSLVKDKVEIKASGGIKNKEQFQSLINAGATRIGTSNIDYLISDSENKDSY